MSRSLFVVVWICILLAARAEATTPDYAYAWPLSASSGSAAYVVELTPEVYAASTRDDLADVEVINADGDSVPSDWYRPPAVRTSDETQFAAPIFTVDAKKTAAGTEEPVTLHIERGADGKLRRLDAQVGDAQTATATSDILVDASAVKHPIDSIDIDWSHDSDATAHFAIDASDDLQNWRTLVADAAVVRLRQDGNTLERHHIVLPNTSQPYLRLRRLNDGGALPALSVQLHAIVWSSAQAPAVVWIDAASDGKLSDPQRSVFAFHLPAALSISSAKLELADDNSIAQTRLLARTGSAPDAFVSRASFVAFRLREGDTSVTNDPQPTSLGNRARDWRADFATPIAHAPKLSLAYTPDRLAFLAQGPAPYRLVAGSTRAHRAAYPIETALRQLQANAGSSWSPPLAGVGAREELQGGRAIASPPPTSTDWKQWLLWVVLLAAVAVVSALALSLLRKSG